MNMVPLICHTFFPMVWKTAPRTKLNEQKYFFGGKTLFLRIKIQITHGLKSAKIVNFKNDKVIFPFYLFPWYLL